MTRESEDRDAQCENGAHDDDGLAHPEALLGFSAGIGFGNYTVDNSFLRGMVFEQWLDNVRNIIQPHGTQRMYDVETPMRYGPPVMLFISFCLGCSFLSKSPALKSPLHERLAKADTTSIEQAAKACLTQKGWKPDDVGGFAEGATVVSAKNAAKERVSVYIQPPEMDPRVTGGPAYDDPFWECLGREVVAPKAAPAASSADAP